MLSGQNPASRPFQFSSLHLVDPTLPEPLVKLIAQMLEMNEQARPTSAAEVKARLEQLFNQAPLPVTVVPPVPAPGNMPTPRQHVPAATADEQSSDLWDSVSTFLSQGKNASWTGFIALSLLVGCLLPLIAWVNIRFDLYSREAWAMSPFVISSMVDIGDLPPYVTILGALGTVGIGVRLLLGKRRRARLELLGGLILSAIASAKFLLCLYFPDSYSFASGFSLAEIRYHTYSLLRNYPHYFTNFAIYLVLFSLWLFVGMRFFLRRANRIGKLLFGIFHLAVGILLLIPFKYLSTPVIWLPALIFLICTFIALRSAFQKEGRANNGA